MQESSGLQQKAVSPSSLVVTSQPSKPPTTTATRTRETRSGSVDAAAQRSFRSLSLVDDFLLIEIDTQNPKEVYSIPPESPTFTFPTLKQLWNKLFSSDENSIDNTQPVETPEQKLLSQIDPHQFLSSKERNNLIRVLSKTPKENEAAIIALLKEFVAQSSNAGESESYKAIVGQLLEKAPTLKNTFVIKNLVKFSANGLIESTIVDLQNEIKQKYSDFLGDDDMKQFMSKSENVLLLGKLIEAQSRYEGRLGRILLHQFTLKNPRILEKEPFLTKFKSSLDYNFEPGSQKVEFSSRGLYKYQRYLLEEKISPALRQKMVQRKIIMDDQELKNKEKTIDQIVGEILLYFKKEKLAPFLRILLEEDTEIRNAYVEYLSLKKSGASGVQEKEYALQELIGNKQREFPHLPQQSELKLLHTSVR